MNLNGLKIAEYFGVPFKYVVGIDGKKSSDVLIGKKIKEIRVTLKEDQKTFANNIGATVSALSNWENGRNKPNDITKRAIEEYAGVKIQDVILEELSTNMISIPVDEYNRLKELEQKHEYIKSLLLGKE